MTSTVDIHIAQETYVVQQTPLKLADVTDPTFSGHSGYLEVYREADSEGMVVV